LTRLGEHKTCVKIRETGADEVLGEVVSSIVTCQPAQDQHHQPAGHLLADHPQVGVHRLGVDVGASWATDSPVAGFTEAPR